MIATVPKLPAPGQRVGAIDGPGVSASTRAGVVLTQMTGKWGAYALVLMDAGNVETCHGLTDQGIGWHVLDQRGRAC